MFLEIIKVMSTLLGCVIAERSNISRYGTNKCSESFLRHMLRMIMVSVHSNTAFSFCLLPLSNFYRMATLMCEFEDWRR